jgi:hypothetical protein
MLVGLLSSSILLKYLAESPNSRDRRHFSLFPHRFLGGDEEWKQGLEVAG